MTKTLNENQIITLIKHCLEFCDDCMGRDCPIFKECMDFQDEKDWPFSWNDVEEE